MKSLKAEKFYPFVVAGAAGVGSCAFSMDMQANAPQLLTATVTFGAVASGFVGTSLSILISLDTPVMHKIRASSYRQVLQGYIGWALVAGIVLALTGIVGLFLDMACSQFFVSAWCFVLAFCVCCLWRLGRMMLYVFGDRENLATRR